MPSSRKKSKPPALDADLRKTIEDLRKAQEQLRERHRHMRGLHQKMRVAWTRYQNLFDGAPVGYIIVDADGRVLECNRIAAEMLGRPSVLEGRSFANFVPLTDRLRFQEQFARCRRGRSSRFEIHLHHGLREMFPAQLLLSQSPVGVGGLRDIRITIVDLTQIKATQAALENAKTHVEEQVDARTRDLRRINRELAEEVARRTHVERQLLEITERERRRFGQDLHDETCQTLTGLALEFVALSNRLEKDGVKIAPRFRHLAKSLTEAAEDSRAIARGLHPVCLGGGLLAALEELTHDVSRKMSCNFKGSLPGLKLPPEVELTLYRIAQEALTNTTKHAKATHASVRLVRNTLSLHLTIEDNGIGLAKKKGKPHGKGGMGLDIQAYRARSIGAELTVANMPKGGVKVSCELPFPALRAKVVSAM